MSTLEGTSESGSPQPGVLCDVSMEYSDRVNFAMQQNRVALIDAVRITSHHAEPLVDLAVSLTLENGEAEPWTSRITRLDPGATFTLRPEEFRLVGSTLAKRTEAERTTIRCDVACQRGSERRSFPIDILPFDHWPGIAHIPELTAAFVTPNHPVVAELLKTAREALRGLSTSDAIDGYQSASRQRASQIAEACFHAVAAQGIGYINPPASFELTGQRVRLVDRIAREKFGTCLDLTLMLASLWEQCGLYPLVLLLEGHAIPAVWTHEAHLPEAVIDDPARIRNLIELGEVIAVESTLVTQDGASYSAAVGAARKRIQSPGASFLAVDIRSARKRSIRPLPLRGDGGEGVDLSEISAVDAAEAESELDQIALAERAEARNQSADGGGTAAEEAPADRILKWQRRLLDLSLQNRLVNFRWTKRSLGLSVNSLADLENMLFDGDRLRILPQADTSDAFLKSELASRQLRSTESPTESQARLLNMFRIAKASIEETGANTLYVALGLLKWFESESSEQPRLAPLILLPITLARTAAGSGYEYHVSLLDEPARSNVTLLEKLRVEFGVDTQGLDRLPEDEHGIDVDLIIRDFRSAIKSMRRWEVTNSAALGLFSFNKFLMWKDLQENLPRLKQNRMVSHIVDRPGFDFDSTPFPRAEELDDTAKPDDLLCTRDADSSQMVAVRSAADRRSFVLEGPPGTGKSQTIANIIADSIARGRRVLFVAEKMAALSVVRKRLEDDGLGRFCLELHSAKATKKQVLLQLEESLAAADDSTPEEWNAVCAGLKDTRARLNEYVRQMHVKRTSGDSLYRMLGRLQRLGEGPTAPSPVKNPAEVTAVQLDRWQRLIADVQHRGKVFGSPSTSPLRGIGQANWSFTLPQQAADALSQSLQQLGALREATSAFLTALGYINGPKVSGSVVEICSRAAAKLHESTDHIASLSGEGASQLRRDTSECIALARRRLKIHSDLLATYHESLLGADIESMIQRLRRHLDSPGVVRLFTADSVRKFLQAYVKAVVPPLPEVIAHLEQARSAREISRQLDGYKDVAQLVGSIQKLDEGRLDRLERSVAWAAAFTELTLKVRSAGNSDLADRLEAASQSAARVPQIKPMCRTLVEAWNRWVKVFSHLREVLAIESGAFGRDTSDWFSAIASTLERWKGHLSDLNPWCGWLTARKAAAEGGLQELLSFHEGGSCELQQLDAAFWRGFGRAWFGAVADGVDAVRSFNADAHLDVAMRFRQLDKKAIALTRLVISSKLLAQLPPDAASVSAQSERGILNRELGKKRRHLPTRKLIESMPTLLPRLKPCFLMSPLSVAQFLDTKLPPFDLVVFDEASQIPVWDAIGAIARGTDVIVVGDSKQMPPTTFFSTLDDDEEEVANPDAVDDMESILKECNASGIPSLSLKWHYRSRHESLIAFSNAQYYKNELLTFPSPDAASDLLGVSFRHVPNGRYDRGGSRTNRVEAEAVVESVVQLLRDSSSQDSIGIVTFSQAQQCLIEDLLDERRRSSPDLETHFSSEVAEPVFIKNLENVQGDERDTIIFSVGYGPDMTGKISMNFGPLNLEGGERRLNVAVTRARRRLIVFSSLTNDQIDLRRTRATGVHHFKIFLDYARRGPSAIAEATTLPGSNEFDSDFERSVWQALTDRGWQVDTQVGCAGYRIDLAVRHPEKPGRYMLGIECDGATYHSAKTARDRDRLRQSVLEGLGWRITRVWSTQWQVDPAGCIKKLVAEIEHVHRQPESAPPPEAAVIQKPHLPQQKVNEPQVVALPTPLASIEHPATSGPMSPAGIADEPRVLYRASNVGDDALRRLDVHDRAMSRRFLDALCRIVDEESPVTEDLTLRRFAMACGVGRIREQFRERFDALREQALAAGRIKIRDGDLWSAQHDPDAFAGIRVPGTDEESQRDIEDVPIREIANGAVLILREQFGLPREELIRETSKVFGCKRVTARVTTRVSQAVDHLLATGRAVELHGNVQKRS